MVFASSSVAAETSRRSAAELMDVLMWNREPVGGPFALTDHTGRGRTDRDFRGKLLLIYFGFTRCADVCPTDLTEMSSVIEGLGPNGDVVQPLFVTLDPERDTVALLGDYVPSFHPRLVGLTGPTAEIDRAAAAYKVFHERRETDEGAYTVDHSAYIYLVDRAGAYVGHFPPGTRAERMVAVLRQHLPGAKAP